jgi:hypothetical protein
MQLAIEDVAHSAVVGVRDTSFFESCTEAEGISENLSIGDIGYKWVYNLKGIFLLRV